MSIENNRNRSLKRSVITSISGKGVSLITQLVAIPLAVGALGLERFGVYAMLTAIFLWTNTASTVVGSALTLKISAAASMNDQRQEARLFSSALFFALVAATAVAGSLYIVLHTLDLEQIFGMKSPIYLDELKRGAALMVFLVPANVLFTLAESTHAGYQKQYINNLLLTAANVFTIAGLVLVQYAPSVPNMVMAMFMPATLSRVINLALLWRSRPYLVPRFRDAGWNTMQGLLVTGSGFALMQIGSLAYQQFSIFYVGKFVGLSAAAYFSMMMQVISMSGSLLIVFTQPLLPALSDAVARKDFAWVMRAHKLALTRLMPYVALAASSIAVFGSFFASVILRQHVDLDVTLRCLWASFFVIVAWEHVGYIFLAGTGRLWPATWLYLAGAFTMVSASLILVPTTGIKGAFAAMCLGPVIFTVVTYPRIISRTFANVQMK
jgi:O-antigen/teichoic acid export membrane protein